MYKQRHRSDVSSPFAHVVYRRRKCLMCDKMFNSEGSQNRICHSCKHQDVFRGMHNAAALNQSRGAVGE